MTVQENYELNIGPQHPSTHGVFRIKVSMNGETIEDLDMIVGYLHRSMEKLSEERTYTQNIPFTDRADYLAAMSNNLGYCLAIEKFLNKKFAVFECHKILQMILLNQILDLFF